MRFYTGVGSRRAPASVEAQIREVAEALNKRDYCLRSGGAKGPDTWFQTYASHAQIFLPWPRFGTVIPVESPARLWLAEEPRAAAFPIAAAVHPAWERLTPASKKLHARNAHQVLGEKLDDPSDFVVCWTPGGKTVGGTATAIKLAEKHTIPMFNLANDRDGLFRRVRALDEILAWIDARGVQL